jgi:hypothetical protein
MDMMVVPHDDGTVEVIAPGQLPAGAVAVNARFINVSGPGLVAPPNGRLTAQQYQDWVARLQTQGYSVTARQ